MKRTAKIAALKSQLNATHVVASNTDTRDLTPAMRQALQDASVAAVAFAIAADKDARPEVYRR